MSRTIDFESGGVVHRIELPEVDTPVTVQPAQADQIEQMQRAIDDLVRTNNDLIRRNQEYRTALKVLVETAYLGLFSIHD